MRLFLALCVAMCVGSPAFAQPPPMEDIILLESYWRVPEIGSISPVWPEWPNGGNGNLAAATILDVMPDRSNITYFMFVYDENVGSWQPMTAVNGITGTTHITGNDPCYAFTWFITIPEFTPWWYSVMNGNPVGVYYEAWYGGVKIDESGMVLW